MKTYLITGGAGSLGQELIKQICAKEEHIYNTDFLNHERIVIRVLDNNEHALSNIKLNNDRVILRKLYGSITDKERVIKAMQGVDIIIHCAAMKNLEITEYNTSELIKTNVLGTDIIFDSAIESKVKKVMFISSDKAISPVNAYGASKLIGEHSAINYNKTNKHTRISIFRSGNFITSNGNVFEVWNKQYAETGKINITDMNCSRYFISTENAAKSVLNALDLMAGGEIYIPSDDILTIKTMYMMINDFLVNSTVKFNSVSEFSKQNTTVIGLRQGEKLHESLYAEHEFVKRTLIEEKNLVMIK